MLSYQGYLPQFTKGFEFPGIRAGKKCRVLIVADDVLSTMPAEGLPAPLSLSGTVYAHTATKDAADDMQNVQRRSRKLKSIVSVLHWASLRRGRAYGLRTVRLICRCTTALSLTVKLDMTSTQPSRCGQRNSGRTYETPSRLSTRVTWTQVYGTSTGMTAPPSTSVCSVVTYDSYLTELGKRPSNSPWNC